MHSMGSKWLEGFTLRVQMAPACPGPGSQQYTRKQLPRKMYTAQLESFRHISSGNITCFYLFFFFHPRPKAGQWWNRKWLQPGPEAGGRLPCHCPCSALSKAGRGPGRGASAGLSTSTNRTPRKWWWACRAVPASLSASRKSPRWPSSATSWTVTSSHNWII